MEKSDLTPRQQEIFDSIVRIINDYVPSLVGDKEIKPDTNITEEGGVDSMGLILVVAKLEAKYGIKIPDRQLQKFASVKDVIDYIDKKAKK